MNKNALYRMKVVQKAPPSDNSSTVVTETKPVFVSNKHNPDVMQEYFKTVDDIKHVPNVEYTQNLWKGITGDTIDFKPDKNKANSKETLEGFIFARDDKRDAKETERVNNNLKDEIEKRRLERETIEAKLKLIKEKNLSNAMKLVDEICGATDTVDLQESVSFDQLKINSSKELTSEERDFNKILEDINSCF